MQLRALLPLVTWCSTLSVTLALTACQGSGNGPATAPQADPVGSGSAATTLGNVASLGHYELALDFTAGVANLTPLDAPRDAALIGDTVTPDITPYLRDTPCADCFQVKAMSLDPGGNLLVDFGLHHPFPTTAGRADLSVFDTRAIVIMPGTDQFNASPRVHTNGDGVPDLPVSGNFRLLANADGYTSHFDEKVTNPAHFNPPLTIPGSVNPFINFFTEANPSPTQNGFPLPYHRFSQSAVNDVKRFQFALPTDGVTQLRVIIVLEARYGVSATFLKTEENPTQPGSRQNPVYFLPAFNQQEAYAVSIDVPDTLQEGDSSTILPVVVAVEDWQAGLIGNPGYGDLAHPEWIPQTSDVAQVTLELPALQAGLKTRNAPASGTGVFGDPYLYNFTVKNELGALAGTYTGLVTVVDDLDGEAASPTAEPGTDIYSFNAYRPFTVTITPLGGANTPPIAVADAIPNPVLSGATLSLIDIESSDPDPGDGIVTYAWDFDISDGRTYVDAINATANQATTSYTNSTTEPILVTASLKVTDMFGASDTEDVVITILPPTGANNPPVAAAEANPNPVASGATVDLLDGDSFDPDAGDAIVEYAWDFDVADGRTYTDALNTTPNAASTTYSNTTTNPILKTAAVQVKDSFGLTDTEDIVIVVQPAGGPNSPPVAVADATPLMVDSGAVVNLIDHDSFDPDAGDSLVEYAWDFNIANGATYTDAINATADQASTTYSNPGTTPITVTASLRVKDSFGLTDTDEVIITVKPVTAPCTPTPPAFPANFRVPVLPEPPYDVNFIAFAWDAVPDPCVIGYAVYRSYRWGVDNTFFLLTDADGDNQIDANEVITDTTWADDTLDDGTDLWTTNTYYWYVVRAIKDTGTALIPSGPSRTAFVYFNDFEDDTFGTDTFFGARDGEIFGRRTTYSYPSAGAGGTGDYGWGIGRSGSTSGAPHFGTRFLDESANPWPAGAFGVTANAKYPAGRHDPTYGPEFLMGYWNTIGPTLATGYENSGIPTGATTVQMQMYHRFLLNTNGGNVEDAAYVAVFDEADWEAGRYKNLKPLPYLSGRDYVSSSPYIPPFLDQQNLAPGSQDPNEQIPAMHLFAGDSDTPGVGAPDWVKTVFDLTPAKTFSRPVVQFCFAGDEMAQESNAKHPGWSIDDLLMVAY